MGDPNDWFDELSLDPEAHPVAMGTRSLGDRPWLVADDEFERDIAIKRDLITNHGADVVHLTNESVDAASQLGALVGAEDAAGLHPIVSAGLAVQEDLCLLNRRPDGWYLDASCLCFPTRWRLQQKVGKHIAEVHGPVDGYDPRITSKVDRLFDQLTDRPVWRRNWFLMTDTTLHQPDRPVTETIITSDRVLNDLYVRSERQTLRTVIDGWIVFTIRIQHQSLGQLLTTTERTEAFAAWVAGVSDDFGRRRHLTPPQRHELLTALGELLSPQGT